MASETGSVCLSFILMTTATASATHAAPLAAYARQAKDSELIQYATEIKVRAERRCGELLRDTAQRGERATQASHGRGVQASVESSDARPPTLADMGLTRDESSRYQQLAAMPAEHFETAVATAMATAGDGMTSSKPRRTDRTRCAPSSASDDADACRRRDRVACVDLAAASGRREGMGGLNP